MRNIRRWITSILSAAVVMISPMAAFAGEEKTDNNVDINSQTSENSEIAYPASEKDSEAETENDTVEQTGKEIEDNKVSLKEEGSADNEESVRKSEKEDIQKVVLPTSTDDVFDFILDPYKLIELTDAAAYDGKKFEKGATLFFKRADGRVQEDYSSESDAVVITNKGEAAVAVELTARVSSLDGIIMTDDQMFKKDKKASLYLALTDGNIIVPIDGDKGATIRATIPAAAGGKETYSFWLIGAANENGDWESLAGIAPKVTVMWKIVPDEMEEKSLSTDQGNGQQQKTEKEEFPVDVSSIEAPKF